MTELDIAELVSRFGRNTALDAVSIFISDKLFLISLWALCAACVLFLDRKRGNYVVLTVMISLVLHFAVSEGLCKYVLPHMSDRFFRIRPWLVPGADIVPLGVPNADSSFPSSHVSSTAAILCSLCRYYRKAIPGAAVFVVLMAFSRMHNGMHYPTDTAAGMVFGTLFGISAAVLTNSIRKRLHRKS